jgi:hypothetical protein
MNLLRRPPICALVAPFILLPSTALIFISSSASLGKEAGYLAGFLFYWIFWCLLVPLLCLGRDRFRKLLVDTTSLFSKSNWLVAVVFFLIMFVTLAMYAEDFVQAPILLILVAIPAATLNGIFEELLWRGLYVKVFPENIWLAILYPAIGFALWHLAPMQVFSDENKFTFVISAFFLGLAYGWIAFKTGSARWTAISHSFSGIIALSGMIAPSILALL